MPRDHLRLVYSADTGHDLPPRWDDQRVTWTPWSTLAVFICRGSTTDIQRCDACGSSAIPAVATGHIDGTPRMLIAERCPDCKHDTVYDPDTHTLWDLDPSDYDDTGSRT